MYLTSERERENWEGKESRRRGRETGKREKMSGAAW
jgi:hypothetical protein